MTEREYIDFMSGDIQDLINALDDDPNTSAKVKSKAKGIQNRINKFYENFEDYGNWIKCTAETPEAPEYEPDSDDKDTGLTWDEMHERSKARAEKLRAKKPFARVESED